MNKKLKSKVTSFQVLGTSPMDYDVVLKVHTHITHCELCGSALEYSFRLQHKESTEENRTKDVMIGSDCVENFMDAHFPLKKESIRNKMKDLVEKTKSSLFLEGNPDITQMAKDIQTYLFTTLRKTAHEQNLMSEFYSMQRSEFLRNISSDIKSVIRKKYLSKPKILKMRQLMKEIQNGKLVQILQENQKVRSQKIADVKEKESDFYSLYLANRINPAMVLERAALNNFEKQNFLKDSKNKTLKIEVISEVY